MVITSMKGRASEESSPRTEVGEIDTRAPFQSVKAAVNLFGEVAVPRDEKPVVRRSRLSMDEIVLMDKEGELILAQNELGKVKEQLENAEATKSRAISDLEKANITLQGLMTKLRAASESKQLVIEATEALKTRAKQLEVESRKSLEISAAWKEELDRATELYKITITELDNEKQELTNIRQDFDASLEAKLAAVEQEEEAQTADRINTERIDELSKEIATMKESLAHVKLSSRQSQQELKKMITEKDTLLQSHRTAMEEVHNKKLSLEKEINLEVTCDLEMMLVETEQEIALLQEEMQKAPASDMDSVRQLTLELEDATKELQGVAEEESLLQSLVASLKLELETVREHISELQGKESGRESVAESMNVEIEKSKLELEQAVSEETDATEIPGDLFLTMEQLSPESKNALREAEEIRKTAEEMKQEAQRARILVEEGDRKLTLALQEVEEAKAAEQIALDEIAILSKRANAARASQSASGEKIKLSVEEFESLSRKVEVSENLAMMKEAAATAQVEAVNASKNEADKRVEASLKEIEDLKTEIEEATKAAELAEEAKKLVEDELQKWHDEREESYGSSPPLIMEDTPTSSDTYPQHS